MHSKDALAEFICKLNENNRFIHRSNNICSFMRKMVGF